MKLVVAFVLVLLFSNIGRLRSALMGPADFVLKYIEKCDLELDGFTCDVQQSLIARGKHAISFNATTPAKISDAMSAKIGVSIKTNGGWKPNFYTFDFPKLCSSLKKIEPKMVKVLADAVNVEPNCPLPRGRYSVKNYLVVVNDHGLGISSYPYGEFCVRVNLVLKQKNVCCIDIFVETVPKRSKKG